MNDLQPVYKRHWRLIKRKEGASEGRRNKIFIEDDITGSDNPFTFAMENVSSLIYYPTSSIRLASHFNAYIGDKSTN